MLELSQQGGREVDQVKRQVQRQGGRKVLEVFDSLL
jgi:hypothetical protein